MNSKDVKKMPFCGKICVLRNLWFNQLHEYFKKKKCLTVSCCFYRSCGKKILLIAIVSCEKPSKVQSAYKILNIFANLKVKVFFIRSMMSNVDLYANAYYCCIMPNLLSLASIKIFVKKGGLIFLLRIFILMCFFLSLKTH